MKVAYISHHRRPCYELDWLSRLPIEELRIIDGDFSSYPKVHLSHVKYCPATYSEVPSFGSTAHLVRYKNYKKYIDDIDLVIVLEAYSSLSNQFISYCRKINKPVIVLVYELIANNPIYKLPPYSLYAKNSIQNATGFICVTELAKIHLLKLGADKLKISVVYPGINISLFKPSVYPQSKKGAIFVGKLEKHKGIDILIKSYEQVIKPYAGRHLTIVGNGSFRKEVEELSKKEKVTYLPFVENKQLPLLLSQNEVFVLPARDTYRLGQKIGAEQFCFAIAEAMACGLKIVSTDCGAIPEVAGKNNFICSQNNIAEFSKYVESALSDKNSSLSLENSMFAKSRYNEDQQAYKLHTELERLAS